MNALTVAGYVIDLEKKELKKIEQKPADKVEPKFNVGDTVTVKPMSCHGKVFKGEPFKIVDIIEDNYVSDDGKTYSISLQDGWELVQQNPAWSEENNKIIEEIINDIECAKSINYHSSKENYEYRQNWLKSLKDRYTWKPSDVQMHYLSWIANIKLGDSVVEQEVSKHLNELYEDLKKQYSNE
jgi:hypothetical protein